MSYPIHSAAPPPGPLHDADTHACLQDPAVQQLLWHYSPGPGAQRGVKDMRGVQVLKAAVQAMGGGRTVVCKSGKDRTAMVRGGELLGAAFEC
jgi:hypothetical protein